MQHSMLSCFVVILLAFGHSWLTAAVPVAPPPVANPTSFSPGLGLGAGPNPRTTNVGDFNGDGKPDIVATNANFNGTLMLGKNNVAGLLGTGLGTFTGPSFYNTNNCCAAAPVSIAVADFNQDGRQDLVIANQDSFSFSYLAGNGDGSFQEGIANPLFPQGVVSRTIIAADFNYDGKQDVALANSHGHNVSISLGNGAGAFQAPLAVPLLSLFPEGMAAGDLNNDGKIDLVVTHQVGSGAITVLLGNGNGTFAASLLFDPAGGALGGVALADVNADSQTDIIVANPSQSQLVTFLGTGTGFQAPLTTPSSFVPGRVAVADFNGDGKLDVAATDPGNVFSLIPGQLLVFEGQGDGTFNAPLNFVAASFTTIALAVADFNRDLRPDVVTAELNQGLTVFLNTSPMTTQFLGNAVAALAARGLLNQGQANALTAKLENALKQIEAGKTKPAGNQLQAFINQVQAFIKAGTLPAAEGQVLITAAQLLINQL